VSRVLLLGLDGVSFSVLDPLFEAGHMPNLRALLARGAQGVLTSTVPPYTPPGWTSIFTGVNPGKHGIFGFTLGNVQRVGGLVRLDRVAAPAIWNAANAQGARMGIFNVPMTYPPPPVDGFAVSGMLTPEGGGEKHENFTHPQHLASKISELVGEYEIDIEVNYEEDWRSTDIIERLSSNLATKRKALRYLLDEDGDVPILFAVLEAPDRLMHVHYKYIDPTCEHFHRPEAEAIRDRSWAFFDEMDETIGDLISWAGDDAFIITMSDHGFGPLEKIVNVNLVLREAGLLTISGAGLVGTFAGVRRLARRIKSVVPKAVYKRAKGVAHGSIDWERTRAFCAPITQQGIYVNLEGREPHGTVSQTAYDAVRDEVAECLLSLVDPDDGEPVVSRVYRREDVIHGLEAHEAADLFPVCRDYAYELTDGLFSPDVLTDWRDLPRGFHRMDGIYGIAGPGVEARRGPEARIYDIAPTALYLAELKIPAMDGNVLVDLLPQELVSARPPIVEKMQLPLAGEGADATPYSPEEEALIEDSLRNLGYL
jgi:predicted AlkP superfamily phosphohydrolase/phosphomutase